MFSRLIPLWAKRKRKYGATKSLLTVFFGPDHDIFGDSIADIMKSYPEYENDIACRQLDEQISSLLSLEDEELNFIMAELAENQFRPTTWGETWRSFLQKVQQFLPK